MALVFKIDITERVGSFIIKDTTGNATAPYPYGYGALTVLTQWITGCKAYIKPPDGQEVMVDLGASFPGVGSEYQIMPWDVNGGKDIISGLWNVRVEMEGVYPVGHAKEGQTFSYCAYDKEVFYKSVECCIDKMTAKVYNTKFDSVLRDEQSRKVTELQTLFNRVKRAICCDDMVSADNIITYLRLNCRCGCHS